MNPLLKEPLESHFWRGMKNDFIYVFMLKACVYFRLGPWGTPQWRKLVPIGVGEPVLSTFGLQSTNKGEEVFHILKASWKTVTMSFPSFQR